MFARRAESVTYPKPSRLRISETIWAERALGRHHIASSGSFGAGTDRQDPSGGEGLTLPQPRSDQVVTAFK